MSRFINGGNTFYYDYNTWRDKINNTYRIDYNEL